jgi:isovaleryl-CoA dehydrogenase
MPSLGSAWNMNGLTCPYTILNWGTEEQREKYIPDLISGKKIGFMALTEPGGGSDVIGAMRTRAVKDGSHYVINGSKMFITYASEADLGLLYCKTDPEAGHKGVSCFIVDTSWSGFKAKAIPMKVLGACAPAAEISIEDLRVPAENLLGEEGKGFTIAMNGLDYGRICVAARTLAIAQACLDASVKYCNEREAFGQKIGRFQMIQHLLADMVVEVEAARLLVYRAAMLYDKGLVPTLESSMAKYYAAEVCARAAHAASEIFGGYGVTDEYPIAHYLNMAHFYRAGEGAANIQRVLIAEDALDIRKANRHAMKRKYKLRSDIQ